MDIEDRYLIMILCLSILTSVLACHPPNSSLRNGRSGLVQDFIIINKCLCHSLTINTAPDDYTEVDSDLTFAPGGPSTQCSDITIINDNIVEGSDIFFIALQSSVDILAPPTVAFITLSDSSSMKFKLQIVSKLSILLSLLLFRITKLTN